MKHHSKWMPAHCKLSFPIICLMSLIGVVKYFCNFGKFSQYFLRFCLLMIVFWSLGSKVIGCYLSSWGHCETPPSAPNFTLLTKCPFDFFSDWTLGSPHSSLSHRDVEQWDIKALHLWWMCLPYSNETLSIKSWAPWYFFHIQSSYKQRWCKCMCVLEAMKTLNSFKDFVIMLWFGINRTGSIFPGGSPETQKTSL